jgi:hypothetical protein
MSYVENHSSTPLPKMDGELTLSGSSVVDLRSDDELWNFVMSWVASQSFSQRSRRFVANTNVNSVSYACLPAALQPSQLRWLTLLVAVLVPVSHCSTRLSLDAAAGGCVLPTLKTLQDHFD